MEILQNSIIKLIVRQGPDLDRKSIILGSGELGYTNDTERLFIGNGFLNGGNITGNLFKGYAPTITDVSLRPSEIGDTAFASDSNKLYALSSGNGSSLSSWRLIGGVYTTGDSQIVIAEDNEITLAPLSANYISTDALSSPLTVINGRVNLRPLSAYHISTDLLTPRLKITSGKIDVSPISSNYVSVDALSAPLTISNGKISLSPLSEYHISENAVGNGITITNGKVSLSSTIPYNIVSTKTWLVGDGLNVTVGGIDYTDQIFNPLEGDVVLGSNRIYAKYNGLSGSGDYWTGIASMSSIATGHYWFLFNNIIPIEYYPTVQIIGEDALAYQARVTTTTVSSCEVKILNSGGGNTDANIILKIDY